MRESLHDLAEKARLRGGKYATAPGERVGAFLLRHPAGAWLWVIMSADPAEWAGLGLPPPVWEHVSVHVRDERRCPTHEELSWVKDLFWGPEECVVHFYPPKSRHVNRHPTTLHLWKPVGPEMPQPPMECV